MSNPAPKLPILQSVEIGGVKIRRHILDLEAGKLSWILKRLGSRLRNQIAALPDNVLPSEEWLEHAKWYQAGVFGLLKEQRERARLVMASGTQQLTDEQYEREMQEATAEMVAKMPREQLEQMLRERDVVAIAEEKP